MKNHHRLGTKWVWGTQLVKSFSLSLLIYFLHLSPWQDLSKSAQKAQSELISILSGPGSDTPRKVIPDIFTYNSTMYYGDGGHKMQGAYDIIHSVRDALGISNSFRICDCNKSHSHVQSKSFNWEQTLVENAAVSLRSARSPRRAFILKCKYSKVAIAQTACLNRFWGLMF